MYGIIDTHLVDVDLRLPLVVAQQVEAAHTDLSEVTGMVLVEVRAVVVLTTGHTTTTWVLQRGEERSQSVFHSLYYRLAFDNGIATASRLKQRWDAFWYWVFIRGSSTRFVPCGACRHDRYRR